MHLERGRGAKGIRRRPASLWEGVLRIRRGARRMALTNGGGGRIHSSRARGGMRRARTLLHQRSRPRRRRARRLVESAHIGRPVVGGRVKARRDRLDLAQTTARGLGLRRAYRRVPGRRTRAWRACRRCPARLAGGKHRHGRARPHDRRRRCCGNGEWRRRRACTPSCTPSGGGRPPRAAWAVASYPSVRQAGELVGESKKSSGSGWVKPEFALGSTTAMLCVVTL